MSQNWVAQSARVSVYAAGMGLVLAGGFVAMRASAAPQPPVCAVQQAERVAIAEVLGGGALRLTDGRKVLLSGIDAPRLDARDGPAPFAAEAKAALARLVEGRSVTLGGAGKPSKSGWLRAQLFAGSGVWVQGELVSNGFARVRTFPDQRDCAGQLLAREAKARTSKKGLWAMPDYAIRSSDNAGKSSGKFGLVEGVVAQSANVGGRIFLNFGEDYKTDFTVSVKPESVKLFADAGLNLEALEGKRLRVRGYVRERNGPTIDAAIPEQIELIQ